MASKAVNTVFQFNSAYSISIVRQLRLFWCR